MPLPVIGEGTSIVPNAEVCQLRCEVIAIGTELLLGIINDTNSTWIGEQLALAGIDSYFQVKVGDNFERIEGSLRTALDRADAVICCGGLGPTQDDITRNVIAHIMGTPLVRDDRIATEIRHRFEARGRTMSPNNLLQADVPAGASPIAQMPGTAPGLVCPVGDKVIYALPGVPSEMRIMMAGTVLPDLRQRSGQTGIIRSRVLKCWGISESGLAEVLGDRVAALDESKTATIAFQASGIEGIKVRITAKSADEAGATAVLDAEEALIRPILGDAIFGIDDETMESAVLQVLRARSLTLATSETLTGGLMASRLTTADPEFQTYCGGTVEPQAELASGQSAQERAAALAQAACQRHGADVGLSAIEPDPDEDMAPGSVVIAASVQGRQVVETVLLHRDRTRMRNFAVITALDVLRKKAF